ncbi:MAG TPA: response regulator, partial [Hanamia sp.]
GDKVLLIAEDDLIFAKIMLEKAHENNMKAVVTTKGNDIIDFINQFHPDAICMDLNMPDTSGWKILDRLKTDLNLRHTPVYIISGEDDRNNGLKRGARNFLIKPIKEEALKNLFNDISDFTSKKVKNLLIVDDNEFELARVVKALEYKDVQITTATTAKEAILHIREKFFDCIILDLVLPDADGLDIIHELENEKSEPETAVLIYSAKDITKKEKARLNRFANRIILKGSHSLEQLTDQVALFLHRVHKELPEQMRGVIENIHIIDDVLIGKKILIVDDDVRNLFALSVGLEHFGFNLIRAESGKDALDILEKNKDIDIVLMDIMMPEMDGYETMKHIRSKQANKDLTIIAVTAKAMKGDRQKCIESGASDYITKPVNIDQLVSLMRVWLK